MTSYSLLRIAVSFLILTSVIEVGIAQRIITFKDKKGNLLQAKIDNKTGSVKRIAGISDNIRNYESARGGLRRENVDAFGKEVARAYSHIMKSRDGDLRLKKAETNNTWWFIEYEQMYRGVPVYNSEMGLSVDPHKNIVTLGERSYPNITVSQIPAVSSEQALNIAKARFARDSATVTADLEPLRKRRIRLWRRNLKPET